MSKHTPEKRAEKLKNILFRLKSGQHVQNRMLKTWLTDAEYSQLQSYLEYSKGIRDTLKDKPYEVVEYERIMNKGLLIYGQADQLSLKGNRAAAKKLFSSAERELERALEYLQDMIGLDQRNTLGMWFDRDPEWSVNNNIGPDPLSMPRVVTSRSTENQNPSHVMTINEVKCMCVEYTIDDLNNPQTDHASERNIEKKLQSLLDKL